MWTLIPLAISFLVVLGVPSLPIFDEWVVIGEQFRSGAPLSFASLLTPVNEHPIPWARVLFGLNGFGGSSQLRLMLISLVVAGVSFDLLRQTFGRQASRAQTFALAFAFYSLAQWESFFMGMVVHFYLYSLGTVLGVWGLHRRAPWISLAGLVLCAGSLASWPLFSLALGLGIVASGMDRGQVLKWLGGLALASASLFFVMPRGNELGSLLAKLSENPWGVLAYGTNYLGGVFFALAKDAWLTGALGLAGLGLCLAVIRRSQSEAKIELGVLWVHLVLLALVTALARIQYGASHGAASRYVALSMPAWIALLWGLSRGTARMKWMQLTLLCLFTVASLRGLVWFAKRQLPARIEALACYREMAATDDWNSANRDACFAPVTHSPAQMREVGRDLKVEF